jgi:single-strand DNA-binding protein
MKDVNKVILLGRLGADPVQKETKNGLAVASFSVATSRRGREEGETQTQWHKVVAWGKQAEACAAYLKRGHTVYVEGTMKSRKYESKDGEARTAFEVHVDEVSFIGGSRKSSRESAESAPESGEEPMAASG